MGCEDGFAPQGLRAAGAGGLQAQSQIDAQNEFTGASRLALHSFRIVAYGGISSHAIVTLT
jgi:hypothetical protein